jgi:hypothetical protein
MYGASHALLRKSVFLSHNRFQLEKEARLEYNLFLESTYSPWPTFRSSAFKQSFVYILVNDYIQLSVAKWKTFGYFKKVETVKNKK